MRIAFAVAFCIACIQLLVVIPAIIVMHVRGNYKMRDHLASSLFLMGIVAVFLVMLRVIPLFWR